jgi:hypothetical protein
VILVASHSQGLSNAFDGLRDDKVHEACFLSAEVEKSLLCLKEMCSRRSREFSNLNSRPAAKSKSTYHDPPSCSSSRLRTSPNHKEEHPT